MAKVFGALARKIDGGRAENKQQNSQNCDLEVGNYEIDNLQIGYLEGVEGNHETDNHLRICFLEGVGGNHEIGNCYENDNPQYDMKEAMMEHGRKAVEAWHLKKTVYLSIAVNYQKSVEMN